MSFPSDCSQGFSHLDREGKARMVDVSEKSETSRTAVAAGRVRMLPETIDLIRRQAVSKGDVVSTARLAGVMGAKQTANLIPLCHPIALTDIGVEITLTHDTAEIEATARCVGRTGVEMEALTAVSVAALTLYDMCKAVDRGMAIEAIRLLRKEGGKSDWLAADSQPGTGE